MSGLTLKSAEFRREREASWLELEDLLDRVDKKGVRTLAEEELARLPILYRVTLSSLSVARAISLDRNVVQYLEALASRAYFCVYGTRQHFLDAVKDFLTHRFPATFWQFRRYVALAAGIFFLGALVGFIMTESDAENFYMFMDPALSQGRDPSATTESLRATLYSTLHDSDELAQFSSFLFTHNTQVGFLCFSLGFLAGIPVFFLLFTNGLLLGAFAALFHSRGLGVDIWGWLLPHGVTEILALIICGAAGLALGHAVLLPGRFPRLTNLAQRGREVGPIMIGAVVMLFAAGLIEGVFRQTVHDVGVRFLVVFATAGFWFAYFGIIGRRRRQ
jgi:uncharacterized membrane protein SpoIIM required for sporulation